MFVPSVSWQTDRFYMSTLGKRDSFPYHALRKLEAVSDIRAVPLDLTCWLEFDVHARVAARRADTDSVPAFGQVHVSLQVALEVAVVQPVLR